MNPIKNLATTEKPTEAGHYLWWCEPEDKAPFYELAVISDSKEGLKVSFDAKDRFDDWELLSDERIADRLWLKVSD